MQVINAPEFKAKCLQLMDVVHETHEEIIITRNGKPVSRWLVDKQYVESRFGLHQDKLRSYDSLIDAALYKVSYL